jgi:putative membrane protein
VAGRPHSPFEDDPDVVDATRRTRLASERTYLAWWRSGLTAFAVGIGAGKVVPELSGADSSWPYVLLGAGFSLLGLAFIAFGWLRERELERALDEGRYAGVDSRVTMVLTLAGVLLGAALIVVLFTER